MKFVRTILRYLVGVVFIVSGFLKGVDPIGTSLKVKEYFYAFLGLDAGTFALWAGIALCLVEFLAGVCVLGVIKFRFFSGLALLMSLFFAAVTLVSAITGKVQDCGCFGEVLHLEPWLSFFKNIVLVALTAFLYLQRHRERPLANGFREWAFIAAYTLLIVGVSVYSLRNLPPADLSDFRPGRNLFQSDSARTVKYKTEILYSKNGVTKTFSLNNLPDTSWKYEETISTVLEGSEKLAKTMPFLLKDSLGEDITESVLKTQKPLVFISFYNAAGITSLDLGKLKNLSSSNNAGRQEVEVFVLSAMAPQETENALKPIAAPETTMPFRVVYSDYKTVVTFNRSNGGATYVNKGIIVKKWSASKYSNHKIMKAIGRNTGTVL